MISVEVSISGSMVVNGLKMALIMGEKKVSSTPNSASKSSSVVVSGLEKALVVVSGLEEA